MKEERRKKQENERQREKKIRDARQEERNRIQERALNRR